MKLKNTFLLCLLICSYHSFSQSYVFSQSTDTYRDLENSTSLNNGMTWDDPEYEIPIGFNFKYFDKYYSSLNLTFWGLGSELVVGGQDSGVHPLLSPFAADLIDRAYDLTTGESTTGSESNISYSLEGQEGNRIFKLEWENAGFYSDIDNNGVSTDFVNIQLWLYESGNEIEVHYGPSKVLNSKLAYDGFPGPGLELFAAYDFSNDFVIGTGLALQSTPTAAEVLEVYNLYEVSLSNTVPNGTVYNFRQSGVSVNELEVNSNQIQLIPNPAITEVQIKVANEIHLDIESINLYNSKGQLVNKLTEGKDKITLTSLESGIYFVHIQSKDGIMVKRLTKY